MLGGAAFALARMAPRRYERLADAGAATGVIDPLLVRAYLRAGMALPAHQPGDGTPHSGAALHLFATGVAQRVVKADVASLYPSLMRAYRIGPARDRLGAMLALVDRLVERRLAAKASARAAPPGSAERYTHEAMSAAMKLVVNSAYGYLAAGGGLTRFADVHAANEVTRRGRETLELMCRELAARGVTLLEADTDGVYFAVPEAGPRPTSAASSPRSPRCCRRSCSSSSTAATRRCCRTSRRTTRCCGYDGTLLLRGVAFRSSRAEPFGEAFLRRAIARLLAGDVAGVRDVYLGTLDALRRRELPTYDVSSRVRLTKTPAQYLRHPRQPARAAVRGDARERPHGVERRAIASASIARSPAPAAWSRSRTTNRADWTRSPRLRRRSLRAPAARHLRGAAGARVHSGRLRGGVRRSRPAVALRAAGRDDAHGAD